MKGKFYGFGVAFLFAASAFALNCNKVQATKTTAFSSNAAKQSYAMSGDMSAKTDVEQMHNDFVNSGKTFVYGRSLSCSTGCSTGCTNSCTNSCSNSCTNSCSNSCSTSCSPY